MAVEITLGLSDCQAPCLKSGNGGSCDTCVASLSKLPKARTSIKKHETTRTKPANHDCWHVSSVPFTIISKNQGPRRPLCFIYRAISQQPTCHVAFETSLHFAYVKKKKNKKINGKCNCKFQLPLINANGLLDHNPESRKPKAKACTRTTGHRRLVCSPATFRCRCRCR